MPYYSPDDFREPTMAIGGTKDARLNRTLQNIANGVPAPAMTWPDTSYSGGMSFAELIGGQAKSAPSVITPGIGGDFMTQYEGFKNQVAEWFKQIDRSFDPTTWGVTNPDGTAVSTEFSWSDPATWPAAFWQAFKPYAMAWGLTLLAILLIAAGFWKSIK